MSRRPGDTSRESDLVVLSWLAARARGLSSAEIGKLACVSAERVRTATNRVRDADVEESVYIIRPGETPESKASVERAYW